MEQKSTVAKMTASAVLLLLYTLITKDRAFDRMAQPPCTYVTAVAAVAAVTAVTAVPAVAAVTAVTAVTAVAAVPVLPIAPLALS